MIEERPLPLPVVPALRAVGQPSPRSPLALAFRRLLRSKGGVLGGGILLMFLAVAIFAPVVTLYDPLLMSPSEALSPPSLKHPAGTDRFGRDILTRIIYGTRISLRVGLISVTIAGFIGGVLGLVAGYYGGRVDAVLSLFVNILLGLPGILLALVILAMLGPGLQNVMIAVGISGIPGYARLIRANTLVVKEQDFVQAARALGSSDLHIILVHILPNVMAPIIVLSTLGVASAILVGASVSYLGLGAKPPTPEWGVMVNDGRNHLRQAWWLSTMPGLAIMITVIGLNLLGDALRDALDPRLKV
jgi:peptide/nickel transport system permease protein